MWYYLYSSTGKREIKIELESRSPKLYDFFVHNNDNGITDYIRLRAKAQNGLTKKLLESLDYLEVLNWNIPVFSGRFVDKLGDSLKNSLTFFPCEISIATGESYTFYMARVLHILPVIDEERSGYMLLTDGSKILDEPVIIKPEIDKLLLIVRDLNSPIPVVSTRFKSMVEENNLKIKFIDTSFTFFDK